MSEKIKVKREYNYDVLRAICCVFIVIMHVAALYTEEENVYLSISRYEFAFCDFFQIITRAAVPCFIMLSGAFNLSNDRNVDYLAFYSKAWSKMGIHVVFFSLCGMIYRLLGGEGLRRVFFDLLNGKPMGHMWYMFMLFGLYIITPFLIVLKREIGEKVFKLFSCVMLVISCIVHFTSELFWLVDWLQYLGYYLIGYVIRRERKKLRKHKDTKYLLGSVLCFLLTFFLNELSFSMDIYNPPLIRNPNFPTVIIGSVMFFVYFTCIEKVPSNKIMMGISNNSFVIYLSHPLVMGIIAYLVRRTYGSLPSAYWFVPALIIVVILICYPMAILYDKIIDYVINQCNRKKNV